MDTLIKKLLVLLTLIVLTTPIATAPGCASTQPVPQMTTIIVVRHAENDPGRDPSLTDAGRARAELLAHRCQQNAVAVVYSTPYKRTLQTAEPAANLLGLEVDTSFGAGKESALASHIIDAHKGHAVLVVAHSNTVPRVIAGLGAGTIPDLDESEYDRLFVVTIQPDGTAHFIEEQYGQPTP